MITLSPVPPGYLPWFDDVGLQNWFNYILNLSMDSTFSAAWSTQGNDFGNGAEIVYNAVSFSWHILPCAEGTFVQSTNFPTRRKKIINTGYNNGVARTGLFVKANLLLNKKMASGTSTWGSQLTVTIPTEQLLASPGGPVGFGSLTHTCILKKVSTGGTITTLKTLTLVNTTTVGNLVYYTFSDATAIGTINAGDVLYVEYTATFTGGAHTNSGDSETYSIITSGVNNIFASIP